MTARGSLSAFFAPASVAVVGASADPSKIGGSVLANLRAGGFAGAIVPVNTRRASVQGLRAIPSILDWDDPVDVAVVAVAAPSVLPVLKECVAKGVKGAVVLSAGFREAGPDGQDREAELRTWLRGQPLRVLGPNCLGWIRPSRRINLTFAPGMPRAGPLGFFSHSGALCTAILDWSRDHGLGFSLFASLGNQADVTETEILEALTDDAETRVVIGYVEGVAEGRAFFEALRAAAARKPCVLMKAGRSSEGARAVSSHTGALAGSDRAFDAAVAQAGAVRANTLEELFDLARALATQPLPRGRRVMIVTNGGGLGILATDAASASKLEVAPLASDGRERLRAVLPPHASVANPVDLVGDATAERYSAALAALGDGETSFLIHLTPQAATDSIGVARAILGATRGWRSTVLAVFAGGARVRAGAQLLEDGGIPCYGFPERAVGALAGMAALAERRPPPRTPWRFVAHRERADAHVAQLRALGRRRLGFLEAAPLLAAYGIATLPATLARTPGETARALEELGPPVALKIVSPDIVHKTEVGGVRVGLTAPSEITAAAAGMLHSVEAKRPGARIEGFLVQKMADRNAIELLLGMVRDPQFGPLVMVGFGGIYVEILKDIATRLAPLSPADALAMLGELRMAPAFRGARGLPAADLEALAETICRFGRLGAEMAELGELEINPLVVVGAEILALDVRGALG